VRKLAEVQKSCIGQLSYSLVNTNSPYELCRLGNKVGTFQAKTESVLNNIQNLWV